MLRPTLRRKRRDGERGTGSFMPLCYLWLFSTSLCPLSVDGSFVWAYLNRWQQHVAALPDWEAAEAPSCWSFGQAGFGSVYLSINNHRAIYIHICIHISYYIQINMQARSFDFWASSQPQIMLDPLGPWVVLDDYLNRCSNCAKLAVIFSPFCHYKTIEFSLCQSSTIIVVIT